MDRASIEFLRGLLPVEDEEFRITSRDTIIPVAYYAMAVNLGSFATTETWLDKAAIEDAAKHFKGYEARRNAKTLPDWVARKPVLLLETHHGLVLLDGRQRAAKLFSEGHTKVRALVIKKTRHKVDPEGFIEWFGLPNVQVTKQLSKTLAKPLSALIPGVRHFQVDTAFFESPDSSAEGKPKGGGGRQPQRSEYHWLKELLVVSVYATKVAKAIVREKRVKAKRIGHNDNKILTTKHVAADLIKWNILDYNDTNNCVPDDIRAVEGLIDTDSHDDSIVLTPDFVENYIPRSIIQVTGLKIDDGCKHKTASEYKKRLTKQLDEYTFRQIEASLAELKQLANLFQRSMALIDSYDRTAREIVRIYQGKIFRFNKWYLIKAAFRHIVIRYMTSMKLDDRLRVAECSAVNITIYHGDPPRERILGRWWAYVFQLDAHHKLIAPSAAAHDTFLQRLAMEDDGQYDELTPHWGKLFIALKDRNKLDHIEQQCWDVTTYKRP
jgi:hypothetical protein